MAQKSEVASLIVSCKVPPERVRGWSADRLERSLRDCVIYVANAVALRYGIGEAIVGLNAITDPADPGGLFTFEIPVADCTKVEGYTRQMWEQAILEFA